MTSKPKLTPAAEDHQQPESEGESIPKPQGFDLKSFRSVRGAAAANVETLVTALPHHKISDAKDFVRLHSEEQRCWTEELCFVNVPIQGQKRDLLHLINEPLAVRYLPSARILRFRLALATKPYDHFFLCHVPSQNLDNVWNASNAQACELAKTRWTQATSRKGEGVEGYKVDFARDPDAFPMPHWSTQTLEDLIIAAFAGRMITKDDDPGLLRLIGGRQALS
jgi:hypothetical protein